MIRSLERQHADEDGMLINLNDQGLTQARKNSRPTLGCSIPPKVPLSIKIGIGDSQLMRLFQILSVAFGYFAWRVDDYFHGSDHLPIILDTMGSNQPR